VLERLTSETFAPHVGERFELEPPDREPLELVLTSCEQDTSWTDPTTRAPFSLIFHAADDRYVPQQICTIRNPEIGELSLFVVPLGPDDRGFGYQVIFT
jgi:hypothetical protein